MLDNLLFFLCRIGGDLSYVILKLLWLTLLLTRLRKFVYKCLDNFYFRGSLNIYSSCYLILKRLIIINFLLNFYFYSISLIFGSLANSYYCFVNTSVVFLLLLFNIIFLFYLYGRVSLVNFIIIINFILFLILFFNISFVFEFVYGLNPIPDFFDILIAPGVFRNRYLQ